MIPNTLQLKYLLPCLVYFGVIMSKEEKKENSMKQKKSSGCRRRPK
jgi:hypothetical protein